jgi:hypothetical protein
VLWIELIDCLVFIVCPTNATTYLLILRREESAISRDRWCSKQSSMIVRRIIPSLCLLTPTLDAPIHHRLSGCEEEKKGV